MQLAQSKKNSIIVNVGTGRSVNINYLFKIINLNLYKINILIITFYFKHS